jgi:hypothetical protein|tara:strand:+ start:176 stop:904 length:729 start_codon:yes stop_codon:yes gene_type:complete
MTHQSKVDAFIAERTREYHQKLLAKLETLKLLQVLKRKNPYLFKVKAINTSQELVESILSAHLSSQEEAIFGGLLEQIAIFICAEVKGGVKSSAEGIDLEFEDNGCRYIVSVKSGPNWGNSASIKKLKDHFKQAKRILGTNSGNQNVIAVNGCCYGQETVSDKGDYLKLCGEEFWTLISDDPNFYIRIIKPIGNQAFQRNEIFKDRYSQVVNRFTREFSNTYCDEQGAINWEDLLKYNSGKR